MGNPFLRNPLDNEGDHGQTAVRNFLQLPLLFPHRPVSLFLSLVRSFHIPQCEFSLPQSLCVSSAHVIGSIHGVPINPRGVPSTDGLWKTPYPPTLTLLNHNYYYPRLQRRFGAPTTRTSFLDSMNDQRDNWGIRSRSEITNNHYFSGSFSYVEKVK